jgi:hypothetical protein
LEAKEGADKSNSPSKPAPLAKESGLVYKYYSDLSAEEIKNYELQPNLNQDQNSMAERGNVLGISIPNLNSWVE